MSCKNPSGMLFVTGVDKISLHQLKARKFKLTNANDAAYKFFKLPEYYERHLDEIKASLVPPDIIEHCEFLQIPCGQCIECRLDYSKLWATRCYAEAQDHEFNYFVTLTYDDEHLPIGEIGNPTLIKDDLQKFIKALRNYGFENLRYFGCGEYGDLTHRPHYHVILFNCPIDDLTPELPYIDDLTGEVKIITKVDSNGDSMFYSKVLANAWKNKGNILIGRCTFKSCAYVARYVVKKCKGLNASTYSALGIDSEFVLMSRKPGIGSNYILQHYDELKANPTLFIPSSNPFISSFGKYFSKIQKSLSPGDYDSRVDLARQFMLADLDYHSNISELSIHEQNLNSIKSKEKKIQVLKRNLEDI